jgi:hypothetical protein
MLINSDSTVKHLWSPITLRNPEDWGDMFSETSGQTRATQYKVPEDIYHCILMFICHVVAVNIQIFVPSFYKIKHSSAVGMCSTAQLFGQCALRHEGVGRDSGGCCHSLSGLRHAEASPQLPTANCPGLDNDSCGQCARPPGLPHSFSGSSIIQCSSAMFKFGARSGRKHWLTSMNLAMTHSCLQNSDHRLDHKLGIICSPIRHCVVLWRSDTSGATSLSDIPVQAGDIVGHIGHIGYNKNLYL